MLALFDLFDFCTFEHFVLNLAAVLLSTLTYLNVMLVSTLTCLTVVLVSTLTLLTVLDLF